MKRIGKILIGLLASLGAFTFLSMIAGVILVLSFAGGKEPPEAPEAMILNLELNGGFAEGPSNDVFAEFSGGGSTQFLDVLIALNRAKTDDRVKGLFMTVDAGGLGFAQAQDLRQAIVSFRESGKPTAFFAETLGEGASGTGAYYIASAFDQIWLQPSGQIELLGIASQQLFFADLLEEWGIKAEAVTRKEYKSAFEAFSNAEMSDANREATTALLDGLFDQIVAGIAEGRDQSVEDIRSWVDAAPVLASEALEGDLIDRLGYRDEVLADIETRMETDEQVSIGRYLSYPQGEEQEEPTKTVAMIHGIGTITRGDGSDGPFGGEDGIKSGVMAKAIRDAVADEDVDAILLRIDSPGGSYVASDTIWREVMLAKAAEKPVIVSMGNVAASGGYFIAMGSDHILAQPGTITGSIGVVFGKLSFEDAVERLNIGSETIQRGANSTLYSPLSGFGESEMARLNVLMDAIYEDFTVKAAQGRSMTVEDLEQYARGRVWTGEDALELGLVDEMGGLHDAILHTKEVLGLEADDLVWLKEFPKQRDPVEALLEALSDGALPFGLFSLIELWSEVSAKLAPLMSRADAMRGPSLMGPSAVQF